MAPETHFPTPLVVPPLSTHKQTFILLHGRGSSATKFGPALLSTPIPAVSAGRTPATPPATPPAPGPASTLAALFPHAKFVFPTAVRSRASVYARSVINQWFDCWHADDDPDRKPWLMAEGLPRTTAFLHDLLRREAGLVGGAGNVVLGGLSQGCAASLVAAMLWEGERLGAVVGMCGWLPFKAAVEVAAGVGRDAGQCDDDDDDDDGFDPFERSPVESGLDPFGHSDATPLDGDADGGTETSDDSCSRATIGLREELELPRVSPLRGQPSITATPVFFGHGVEDDKVPVHLGRESADCLASIGVHASWHEYEGLGHWYSEAMLMDLVDFLQKHTGWGTE